MLGVCPSSRPFRRIPPRLPARWAWSALLAALLLAVTLLPGATGAAQDDVPALLRLLEQSDPQARRRALLGLADQGDFAAVPRVAKALHDADSVARRLAERALWKIWGRSGDAEVNELFRTGTRLLSSGHAAQSVPVFTRIIGRLPTFAEGWNKRATAYYQMGDYERSLRDIAETLARNPYHFGALSGAGLCLIELERFGEALDYLERALKINPNLQGIEELREAIARRSGKTLT